MRLKIGQEIKKARKNLGKTQQQLSQQTGINRVTLSKIENGRFSGTIHILEQYLDAVGLELTVKSKTIDVPQFHELEELFGEDAE